MMVNIYNSLINRCRRNNWLSRHHWIKQFIKFSIAGGICTILDFLIYVFLTRPFPFWVSHLALANLLSTCLAATVNFVWNRNWTFRSRSSRNATIQYLKFWAVVLGGLVFYQALFFVLVGQLRFFDLLGKAIAAAIVWILRFIFNKFWSFK